MNFRETPISGLVVVELEPRADERGFFSRWFCVDEFRAAGLDAEVVQANVSRTERAGTVRGLHYQLPPSVEDKYVRCPGGAIFDVGVDVRAGSPTFGIWFGIELSASNLLGLVIPKGVAHGFQALTDGAEIQYLVSSRYAPDRERGVHHADADIAIKWPLPVTMVTVKDDALPRLQDADAVVVEAAGASERS